MGTLWPPGQPTRGGCEHSGPQGQLVNILAAGSTHLTASAPAPGGHFFYSWQTMMMESPQIRGSPGGVLVVPLPPVLWEMLSHPGEGQVHLDLSLLLWEMGQ